MNTEKHIRLKKDILFPPNGSAPIPEYDLQGAGPENNAGSASAVSLGRQGRLCAAEPASVLLCKLGPGGDYVREIRGVKK